MILIIPNNMHNDHLGVFLLQLAHETNCGLNNAETYATEGKCIDQWAQITRAACLVERLASSKDKRV